MQLICPECSARYSVSSSALGEEGRDVRCVKCSHEWFEVPENLEADTVEPNVAPVDNFGDKFEDNHVDETVDSFDEIDDGADDSFALGDTSAIQQDIQDDVTVPEINTDTVSEDIPDSVKPLNDDAENVPALAGGVVKSELGLQAKLMGYILALLIFAMLIVAAIIFKKHVVSAWIPSAAIYELAGFPVEFQGQHLVMENLTAKAQRDVNGKNYLLLEGRVINLTNEVQYVPPLVAQLRSTSGEDSEAWPIDTPLQRLEPGESFTFKSDYPDLPDGSGSINLSFKPTLKH